MSNTNVPNQQYQLEKDKKSIYMHPLFPLLKLLLEKCEQATTNPEIIKQEDFNKELKLFIDEHKESAIQTQNKAIDELILKSIQVLRIHLLELEKVNELCKDFCQRYITCLKIKLNSDNIFKNELNYSSMVDDDDNDDENLDENDDDNENSDEKFYVKNNENLKSNLFSNILNSTSINGNTPLSQIGCNELLDNTHEDDDDVLANLEFEDDDSNSKNNKKSKRGILPKHATNIMKQWLFQHIVHPYPTEDEKKQIASQTNLTLIQVNNWFINARRRILQPMLEASNPDMAKKKKTSNISSKPYQNNRYWPQNIVNIALKTENKSSCKNDSSLVNEDDDIEINEDDNDSINYASDDANRKNSSLCQALKVENLLNNDNYYTQQQLNNNYNNLYEPLGVNKLTQHQHRTQQPSRTNNQSTDRKSVV